VGPVIELAMGERDLVAISPDGRFASMPRAMALLVLRRALWPAPRDRDGMRVRVAFRNTPTVWLDEAGTWQTIDRAVSPRCHPAV
jgi:hypothetical protein